MFFKKKYIKDIESIKKDVSTILGYCFWLEDSMNLIKKRLNVREKLINEREILYVRLNPGETKTYNIKNNNANEHYPITVSAINRNKIIVEKSVPRNKSFDLTLKNIGDQGISEFILIEYALIQITKRQF